MSPTLDAMHYCPFCDWTLSYSREEIGYDLGSVEAWLKHHLASHVEEMMSVTTTN